MSVVYRRSAICRNIVVVWSGQRTPPTLYKNFPQNQQTRKTSDESSSSRQRLNDEYIITQFSYYVLSSMYYEKKLITDI